MNESGLAELIALGAEQRGVEFKGPGRRDDKAFFAKVARAVMAMANRRDGGRVIIGVDDVPAGLEPTGLTAEQLSTWTLDDFGDALTRYVDPPVVFELEALEHASKSFVVVTVAEFEQIPILCKRDFPGTLRDGACYVRSRRKPESVEVPSHAEMRELLDLATDKALRRYISRARTAGLIDFAPVERSDAAMFDAELPEDLR